MSSSRTSRGPRAVALCWLGGGLGCAAAIPAPATLAGGGPRVWSSDRSGRSQYVSQSVDVTTKTDLEVAIRGVDESWSRARETRWTLRFDATADRFELEGYSLGWDGALGEPVDSEWAVTAPGDGSIAAASVESVWPRSSRDLLVLSSWAEPRDRGNRCASGALAITTASVDGRGGRQMVLEGRPSSVVLLGDGTTLIAGERSKAHVADYALGRAGSWATMKMAPLVSMTSAGDLRVVSKRRLSHVAAAGPSRIWGTRTRGLGDRTRTTVIGMNRDGGVFFTERLAPGRSVLHLMPWERGVCVREPDSVACFADDGSLRHRVDVDPQAWVLTDRTGAVFVDSGAELRAYDPEGRLRVGLPLEVRSELVVTDSGRLCFIAEEPAALYCPALHELGTAPTR